MRITFAVTLFILVFSAALRAQIEEIEKFDSAAIAEIEKISEAPGGVALTINVKAAAIGSTSLGVRDFTIEKHPLSEVDRHMHGGLFLIFIEKATGGDERILVHSKEKNLAPISFIPLKKTIGYEAWSSDDRLSSVDNLAKFLSWIVAEDQGAGSAYGFLTLLMRRGVDNIAPPVTDYLYQLTQRTDNQRLFSLSVAALVEARDYRGFEQLLKAVVDRRWDLVSEPLVARSLRTIDPRKNDHIPFLMQMIKAESPTFRREVVLALATNHSVATLPALAGLLDDDDPDVAAYAVGGLAMFANGVPPGGVEPTEAIAPYRTTETIAHSAMSSDVVSARRSYYIDFWRSWWDQHSSKILFPAQ